GTSIIPNFDLAIVPDTLHSAQKSVHQDTRGLEIETPAKHANGTERHVLLSSHVAHHAFHSRDEVGTDTSLAFTKVDFAVFGNVTLDEAGNAEKIPETSCQVQEQDHTWVGIETVPNPIDASAGNFAWTLGVQPEPYLCGGHVNLPGVTRSFYLGTPPGTDLANASYTGCVLIFDRPDSHGFVLPSGSGDPTQVTSDSCSWGFGMNTGDQCLANLQSAALEIAAAATDEQNSTTICISIADSISRTAPASCSRLQQNDIYPYTNHDYKDYDMLDVPLAAVEGMWALPRLHGDTGYQHNTVADWESGGSVAAKSFIHGAHEGITDIFIKTYTGKKTAGAKGVAKGLSTGLVNMTMKTGAVEPGATWQDRSIVTEGTLNMRDLGGLCTSDGRHIIKNRLFRSANLAQITSNDLQTLAQLGIKTVVDLRGPKEALDHPDRLPAGTAIIPSPIIGSDTGDAIHDSTIRTLVLCAGLPETMLNITKVSQYGPYYRMLFLVNSYGTESHTSRLTKYRPFFRALLDLAPDETILVHCTGGRDRTGVGIALWLRALGVSQQDIEADFVASNHALQPDREDPDSTTFLRFQSANVFLQPPANKYYQRVAKELGAPPESIRNAVKLRADLLRR
ncbi:hypothetical protein KCU89_g7883, partial [Aureobasidium melanogenum]